MLGEGGAIAVWRGDVLARVYKRAHRVEIGEELELVDGLHPWSCYGR